VVNLTPTISRLAFGMSLRQPGYTFIAPTIKTIYNKIN